VAEVAEEGAAEGAVTEVEVMDGGADEELGVVGIAKAGTTKGPSRPPLQLMMN